MMKLSKSPERLLQKKSSDRYLVVSLSARALAASLSAAGFSVAAIDLFCDQDLCQITNLDNHQKVPVFDTPNLLHAINKINEKTPCNYLIVGGGIESCPELLDQLPDNMILLGNSPEVLQATNNPEIFFKLLDKLKIPFPKTIFDPPEVTGNWLAKQAGSCGGSGVSMFDSDQTYSPSFYFQRYIKGRVCSVVFVADSQTAKVIGYNEIWNEGDKSFRFSGAISLPNFSENPIKIIDSYLQLLTDDLELIGLCGMDFIIDDQEKIHVLEINPRPTATFELHDQKGDLLLQHISACRYGMLESDTKIPTDHVYTKQVCYSEESLKIDREIQWPEWSADLPQADQIINAHDPVCTIYADGGSAKVTKALLLGRMNEMKNILKNS